MICAYADPPYPGCAHLYGAPEVDHRYLVRSLVEDYPDGWALSTSAPALRDVLQICPPEARVAPWVKPFASFKPGVNPAYCWEPVIFVATRKRARTEPTVRDFVAANITLRRGFTGAKPTDFCFWLFALLGLRPTDEFVDVFTGTGGVSAAWAAYQRQGALWGAA